MANAFNKYFVNVPTRKSCFFLKKILSWSVLITDSLLSSIDRVLKTLIHSCLYNFLEPYFKSEPGPRPDRTFWKMDPRPLEKADPIPKFTVWVKDSFLTNLWVLISNMTIAFFKILAQKYPKKAFLVPNLGILVFFLHNFAIKQIWGGWIPIWK